jgi:hypothetical protein
VAVLKGSDTDRQSRARATLITDANVETCSGLPLDSINFFQDDTPRKVVFEMPGQAISDGYLQ